VDAPQGVDEFVSRAKILEEKVHCRQHLPQQSQGQVEPRQLLHNEEHYFSRICIRNEKIISVQNNLKLRKSTFILSETLY
jgi:hypothetical protein